jgi:transaldolase/glucose-6-phosphate isomerase
MADLGKVGISMKDVTDKLTNDGVKLFADAFDTLLAAVEKEHASESAQCRSNAQSFPAPDLDIAVKKNLGNGVPREK